jgi:nitrogen fixation/metabolism regulation signal transduction histidine kinase
MPLHEKQKFNIKLPDDEVISRERKLRIADKILGEVCLFLNGIIEKEEMTLPKFPDAFDPTHVSRWLYFFLREAIRNSIDSFFLGKKTSTLPEITITLTTNPKTKNIHLKVKDNGVGFLGIEKSLPFTKKPDALPKDKKVCLGGKGFGLGICEDKLGPLTFKNRKDVGASVQVVLDPENSIKRSRSF